MTGKALEEHMNMVGHDDKRMEAVSETVKEPQRGFDILPNLRVFHDARAASGIQK